MLRILLKLCVVVFILTTGFACASDINEPLKVVQNFCAHEVKTAEQYEKNAEKLLPIQDTLYSYDEISQIFSPIIQGETEKLFRGCFEIMFRKDFPKARHEPVAIIKFFRCLHARLAEANAIQDLKDRDEAQLIELSKSLAFHTALIAKFDKDLAAKIIGFPCDSCKNSALTEIGLLPKM